jgi:hypothetical protein
MSLFSWLFPSSEDVDSFFQPDNAEAVAEQVEPETDKGPQTMGDLLNALGLKVVHVHPNGTDFPEVTPTHSATVVFKPRQDENHTIKVAVALCGPKDTFSKRRGLTLALLRFMRGQTVNLSPRGEAESDVDLIRSYFG